MLKHVACILALPTALPPPPPSQRLGPEDSQFIYDAACGHCVEIATHRHGCCVLQRCIDFATPAQKVGAAAQLHCGKALNA